MSNSKKMKANTAPASPRNSATRPQLLQRSPFPDDTDTLCAQAEQALNAAGSAGGGLDLEKVLATLREERAHIAEAILLLERLAARQEQRHSRPLAISGPFYAGKPRTPFTPRSLPPIPGPG